MSRRLSGGSPACFFAPSSAAGLERASQARAGTTTVPASADMAKWKKVTVTVKPLSCCSTRLVRVSLIRLSDTQAANSAPTSSTARARCFGACSSLLPESAAATRALARRGVEPSATQKWGCRDRARRAGKHSRSHMMWVLGAEPTAISAASARSCTHLALASCLDVIERTGGRRNTREACSQLGLAAPGGCKR
eukprot:scaffold18071_cov65-Phaeocystis_antarctica.AAC.1